MEEEGFHINELESTITRNKERTNTEKENKQSQEVVTIRKTKSTSNAKNVVKGFSR